MNFKYSPLEAFTGLLIFEISGREYCLNYSIVTSTVKPPFKIRNYRENKKGHTFLSFNDHSIPLINLKHLLKRKGSGAAEEKDSRVILVEDKDKQFGLLVENIKEVIALDAKFITTSVKFNPGTDLSNRYAGSKFIEGSLEFEGRSLQLLNIEELSGTVKILKTEA